MQLKAFQVDAFTNSLFKGNPAAVVILENEISGEEFLIFNRPTVADCTLFSTFTFSESLNLNIHNEYKNIGSWYLKFKNRESSKS